MSQFLKKNNFSTYQEGPVFDVHVGFWRRFLHGNHPFLWFHHPDWGCQVDVTFLVRLITSGKWQAQKFPSKTKHEAFFFVGVFMFVCWGLNRCLEITYNLQAFVWASGIFEALFFFQMIYCILLMFIYVCF